jgi:hypothetical protein
VKRYGAPFLQDRGTGKGLWQKVRFARRQAYYNQSNGAVFVMDSEGDLEGRKAELTNGRDAGPASLPMAVGVAHPCIESWLLADAGAIHRAMNTAETPEVPDDPENLPAPSNSRQKNPKTELARAANSRKLLAAKQKDAIAKKLNDMILVRTRCPLGFAPFADEVEEHIHPLF